MKADMMAAKERMAAQVAKRRGKEGGAEARNRAPAFADRAVQQPHKAWKADRKDGKHPEGRHGECGKRTTAGGQKHTTPAECEKKNLR